MADAKVVKELRQKCNDLEDKLDTAEEERKEAKEQLAAAREELEALRARAEADGPPATSEEHLQARLAREREEREQEREKERIRLEELQVEVANAAQARDAALDVLKQETGMREALEASKQGEEQTAALQVELDELRRLLYEGEQRQLELQRQHDDHVRSLKAMRQRSEELEDQLEVEQQERATASNSLAEMQRGRDEALQQLDAERLNAEQMVRDREQLQARFEEAAREYRVLSQQAAALGEELEQERRQRAAEVEVLQQDRNERQALCDELEAQLKARKQASELTQGELERAREALSKEEKTSSNLQQMLDAIQTAHQDIFTRYSAAVEQIESLKEEKSKASAELKELHACVKEERREKEQARREFKMAEEEAAARGPQQLSVSDVLIRVVFDGVEEQPLEIKPWDTNVEDVVANWLTHAKRSSMLQPSLVQYLKHLEDTTPVFPVRVEPKLLDVHQEFAMRVLSSLPSPSPPSFSLLPDTSQHGLLKAN